MGLPGLTLLRINLGDNNRYIRIAKCKISSEHTRVVILYSISFKHM